MYSVPLAYFYHCKCRTYGFAQVKSVQVLAIDFLPQFEETIVAIQEAVQMRTTQEYRMDVIEVLKDIDVMNSQTNATITAILAQAQAEAMVLFGNASAIGLLQTQAAKVGCAFKHFT